jgi:hypothetical protein
MAGDAGEEIVPLFAGFGGGVMCSIRGANLMRRHASDLDEIDGIREIR